MSEQGAKRNAADKGAGDGIIGQAGDLVRNAAGQAGGFATSALESSGRVLEEGRRLFPEPERYYHAGAKAARAQVGDSPVTALLVAGALGYALAWLVHGRR